MGRHNSPSKNISLFHIFILVLNLLIFTCEARPPFACDPANGVTRNLPFCRVSLHINDRVNDLIGRLTLPEKIRLLVNNAAPVDRLGIKGYEWWSEALHGVSNTGPGVKFGGDFPAATSFPQVITTAASYNATLWEAIGQVVSDEARAMYNGGRAGLTYWSPNVNIFRDPRWGRGQETPGEDPTLAARYAASYVKGLQGGGGGNRLKVAACCKHYTAYDLDFWNGMDRFHFNAKVSKQDLEETYNVPFKACVSEGKVASIMCSYNQVNGKPTCADPTLLRDTIRAQWRLNGYIVSDCDSVDVLFRDQHYTATPEDAAAASIKAGLDLDCGPFLALHTEGAIRSGKLSEADVNQALANLLTVQMRLGMFDGPRQPYLNLGPKDVCTPAHQQLALEAARQGIVLLQNRNRALPLSTRRHHTVAVIGPNSDATDTMIGNYAGIPCGYTTPLQGILRYVKTIHETGCEPVTCTDNRQFGRAEVAARQADATVLVVGLSQAIEREGLDRDGLLLPGHQQELVSRVAKASRGPVVLVLMSGGPIDITFAKNDPKISAILWAGYPGQAGGTAIADILFGTTNPGGKLPMTWYPQDYLTKVPMTDMGLHADPSRGYPGRTYRFYKGQVVFPFGFGLSYTSFKHTITHVPTKISIPFTSSNAFKNMFRHIPVWIKLPGLPLDCWNPEALSIIASGVGKPIATDMLTHQKDRISYARVLVEIDAATELVKTVEIETPCGIIREQDVVYDFEPKFCESCKLLGHFTKACPTNIPLDKYPKRTRIPQKNGETKATTKTNSGQTPAEQSQSDSDKQTAEASQPASEKPTSYVSQTARKSIISATTRNQTQQRWPRVNRPPKLPHRITSPEPSTSKGHDPIQFTMSDFPSLQDVKLVKPDKPTKKIEPTSVPHLQPT